MRHLVLEVRSTQLDTERQLCVDVGADRAHHGTDDDGRGDRDGEDGGDGEDLDEVEFEEEAAGAGDEAAQLLAVRAVMAAYGQPTPVTPDSQ